MSENKNPNPVSTPSRDTVPLQEGYNLDAEDPIAVVRDIIKEKFTGTIVTANDVAGVVLTKPQMTGEDSGPQELSVRGRVKKLHDYLPIVLGPPGEESDAQRLELCKINLHPVFTTTQPSLYADIGPGTNFIGELKFPEAPFEYYNGTLKSKQGQAISVHGFCPVD